MIAVRGRAVEGTSDFGRLVAYILNEAKVEGVRITNCDAATPKALIDVVKATQGMNVRAKGDKTYHLVVSFPPGERPADEQLADIEQALCEAIGLGAHERLSGGHVDREHFHLHVAVNKVHPQTFRFVEPYYDKKKLNAACARLEVRHGLTRTNHGAQPREGAPGRAGDLEAHAGEASLLGRIRTEAAPSLLAAVDQGQGWRDLHEVLAAHGLEIRPRGAGLVIAAKDGGGMVKASSVDRRLSLKALTARWGAFEAATAPQAALSAESSPEERSESERRSVEPISTERPSPRPRYERHPRQPGAAAKALYAEFQRQRAAALETRNAAFAKRRRARARSGDRPDSAAQIKEAHPLPTWLGFLQARAAQGDADALAALRWRKRRQRKAAQALLTAENADEARHVVLTDLRPYARRNGALVYRVRDGGVVVDEARQVRVEENSAHAAFLALTLASERFAGQALVVEGTDAFKRELAAMAAAKRLDLRFADPAMEAERQWLFAATDAPTPSLAAEAYVEQRNALRQRIPSIKPHRLWTSGDAGKAIYLGRRCFQDGSEAFLLKKSEEVLVKPATTIQGTRARQWRKGQTVFTDDQGQYVGAEVSRGRQIVK